MVRFGIGIAFSVIWALAAAAQDAPRADPNACAPGERLKPGLEEPAAPQTGETLSERLARTDGVLCPPNVDPEMKAPTPDAGRTPVIPPPGTPGGDPTVRPK